MTTTVPSVDITPVPLWRIRLKLLAKSLRNNWALFAENRVGLVGLGAIIFFGLFEIILKNFLRIHLFL